MKSAGVFLMALVVLRVSAKPQVNNSFQSSSYKIIGGCGSTVPSLKTHVRTSVVENPTINFPSFIPPSTVTQSCHCLRTIVRPQIRNEIITVPTVDKIVRTVATPVVETVDCGGNNSLGSFNQPIITRVFQNGISTLGGNNNGLFGDEKTRSFANSANGCLKNSNGISSTIISQPTISTFQNINGKNLLSSGSIFSGNSGYLNNGQILSF